MTPLTEGAVLAALREVRDPEVGLSIVELGLVFGIRVEGASVAVTLTLTTAGCPLHGVMTDWVHAVVGRLPGVARVDVTSRSTRRGRRTG